MSQGDLLFFTWVESIGLFLFMSQGDLLFLTRAGSTIVRWVYDNGGRHILNQSEKYTCRNKTNYWQMYLHSQ